MPASTFYVLATVIFLELFIIIAMLINIKFLLKTEKEKVMAESGLEAEEAKNLNYPGGINSIHSVRLHRNPNWILDMIMMESVS